ncbi:hypothetical protein [Flexibacter flexilis]|nr:hypothetical protein [Flexibacter flexilis]
MFYQLNYTDLRLRQGSNLHQTIFPVEVTLFYDTAFMSLRAFL